MQKKNKKMNNGSILADVVLHKSVAESVACHTCVATLV
jgi:hypothetical protein